MKRLLDKLPLGGIALKPDLDKQASSTTGTQASGQFLHDLETHAHLPGLKSYIT